MRKALIIAYIFPPAGGSGVQRMVKFATYLPEFGWQPVALTVSNPPSREADPSLSKELPDDLPVYRAPDVNLVYLARRVVSRLFSPGSRHAVQAEADHPDTPGAVGGARRAWRDFCETWLMVPDHLCYWFPPAVRIGLTVVKQCDVIMSTDPFTGHLVACFLHKLSGKPWIADFRDPWTQYMVYHHRSSGLRWRLDAFLEEFVLRNADGVTVTCAATAQSFQDLYPSLAKEKFVEITNGFDAADFDQPDRSRFDKFTIAYTGRFGSKKNATPAFLQALRDLRREYPKLAEAVQVVFAGVFGEQNYALVKQWDLEGMVKPAGYVAHQESVGLLLKSHVLLLTLNDEPGVDLTYPGKIFEYLAAGQAILALVPEGPTADLVRNMEAGLVVPPDDPAAIKRAILDLYDRYKQGDMLSRNYEDLQRFERRNLTAQLAQCMSALLQDR